MARGYGCGLVGRQIVPSLSRFAYLAPCCGSYSFFPFR